MADAQENRMDEMERSLGAIQTEMREQIARTRVNTRVLLIVGLVVVIILCFYLSYLIRELKSKASPEAMADILVKYASDHATAFSVQIEDSLKKAAPTYVKAGEQFALEQIPDLRKQAVASAKTYFAENAPKWRTMLIDQGKAYIKDNAEQIRVRLSDAGKQYLDTLLAQLPDLRTKALETIDRAVAQLPDMRKSAEEAATKAMDGIVDTFDKQADALVEEMITKKAAELKPLIAAAATPDGATALTAEFTKDLDELVGVKMDSVLKEFDETLTPHEQYLDELLAEKLTKEQQLHKEMITAMLLMLDDALALGQIGQTPTPAPVLTH